jgi:mRNA interferase RelE/StbE
LKREVRFTATAVRELDRLPGEVKDRVMAAAAVLADDPLRGKPLKGELKGLRSLRVGTYRVLYSIEGATLHVRAVGHRGDIYR